jgi:hypothetical protein
MELHNSLSMFEVFHTSSFEDLKHIFKDFITADGYYTIPNCLFELRSVCRHVPDPNKTSAGTVKKGTPLSEKCKQEIVAGVAQEYKKSVEWYMKASAQGDTDAQCALGNAWHNGKGVVQHYKRAIRWYENEAAQGQPVAQSSLGQA